ncbi:homeotic protein spalt-major-like isoform X5 [Lineus longissimus]|uniref:homeotic protein spalt-major-like isoform X5 n=1 Tax=Lineus longissimus TaxID=88925 RepID=UPI00315DE4CC
MSLPETQLSDDDGSPSPSLIMQQAQAERPIMNMQTEHPFQNMQTELQSKGAVLTKAWSDLFSFITRYQAELVVKENSVEMAEKEINMRKWHLDEMKPVVDAGNEEITKLQEEIQTSQRLLNRTQSELTVKEQMLQSVRSDLNCNMEMLDKSRSELLGKQTEVVRYRADLERLKSELTIQQEQISIKDNLLKKLQNQLMKENAELKEQLDNERQTLELERNYHELTKMDLRKSKALLDEENKSGIDPAAGAMMMDTQRDLGMMPGTPSSGASDSNQGPPVPISGPIPAAGMSVSPGGLGGDGKFLSKLPKLLLEFIRMRNTHIDALFCEICGKRFSAPSKKKYHMRIHSDERPFQCSICQCVFRLKHHLKNHMATHRKT